MAHNNGMIPRAGGRGFAESAGAGWGPMTGAEIAGFVPHRPVRPEKSEGGKRFKLVSEYEPAGDQPTAIKELVGGIQGLNAARAGETENPRSEGGALPDNVTNYRSEERRVGKECRS